MIAVATGILELDNMLTQQLTNTKIVTFKELLLKERFDTVILSRNLPSSTFKIGDNQEIQELVSIDEVVTTLLNNRTRIVYIASSLEEAQQLIEKGVYDVLIEPVKPQEVLSILKHPRTKEQAFVLISKVTSPGSQQLSRGAVISIWTHDSTRDSAQVSVALAKAVKKLDYKGCALLDFDELTGRISQLLNVPEVSIEDFTKLVNSSRLSLQDIYELLPAVDNIRVFSGINIRNAFRVNEKHLSLLVDCLSQLVDFVIIHAGSGVSTSGVVTAFKTADKVVAITPATHTDIVRCIEILDFICTTWGVERKKINLYAIDSCSFPDVDGGTLKELADRYSFGFIGMGGKKYIKHVQKIVPTVIKKR